jgi:hypothetical protein
MRNGFGMLKTINNSNYMGQFKDDECTGYGIHRNDENIVHS